MDGIEDDMFGPNGFLEFPSPNLHDSSSHPRTPQTMMAHGSEECQQLSCLSNNVGSANSANVSNRGAGLVGAGIWLATQPPASGSQDDSQFNQHDCRGLEVYCNTDDMSNKSHNGSLPNAASEFIKTWLALFPAMPEKNHYNAFSDLTGSSALAIENWFAIQLRSGGSWDVDSGYLTGTGSFSGVSSSPSLNEGLSSEAEHLCKAWLLKFSPMPNTQHIKALGCLVDFPASAVEHWFAVLIRSNIPSYSTMGSSNTPPNNLKPLAKCPQNNLTFSSSQETSSFNSYSSHSVTDELTLTKFGEAPQLLVWPDSPIFATNAAPLLNDIQTSQALIVPDRGIFTQTQGNVQTRVKSDCLPTSDQKKLERNPLAPYQCTSKCGAAFKRTNDLKRHEERKYPQQVWVCLVGPETVVDGVPHCSYCDLTNPPPNHLAESHMSRWRLHNKGENSHCGAVCRRNAHLKQHFNKLHSHLESRAHQLARCDFTNSNFPKYCGFCVRLFPEWSWEDRHRHICAHFKSGKYDMLSWRDPVEKVDVNQLSDNDDSDDDEDDHDLDDNAGDDNNNDHQNDANQDHTGNDPHDDRGNHNSSSGGSIERCKPGSSSRRNGRRASVMSPGDGFFGLVVHPGSRSGDPAKFCHCQNRFVGRTCLLNMRRHVRDANSLSATAKSTGHTSCTTGSQSPSNAFSVLDSESGTGRIGQGGKLLYKLPWYSYSSKTHLGHFSSQRLLGRGGFSVVDKVIDKLTGFVFARKTFLKNKDAQENYANEMRILSQIRHTHIVRLVGSYSQSQSLNLLLFPAADMNLSQYINNYTPTESISRAVMSSLGCLATALEYLHSGLRSMDKDQFVGRHNDIKPENILVFEYDYANRPKFVLADFGLSHFERKDQSCERSNIDAAEGHRLGTSMYQPPEVRFSGNKSSKMDMWSFGCVLVEVLSWIILKNTSEFREYRHKFFRENKYFHENISETNGWLESLQERSGTTYAPHIKIIKAMLDPDQSLRPTASQLLAVFPPATCCLSSYEEFRKRKLEADAKETYLESVKRQRPVNNHVCRQNTRKQMRSFGKPSPTTHYTRGVAPRNRILVGARLGEHSTKTPEDGGNVGKKEIFH